MTILLSVLLSLHSALSTPLEIQGVDPCKLYGPVFVEQNLSWANYKIFVETDEAFSDLLVYEEATPAFASKPGHWYFTPNRYEAVFTVAFTDTKGFADFSIYYTQFQSLAGCPKKN